MKKLVLPATLFFLLALVFMTMPAKRSVQSPQQPVAIPTPASQALKQEATRSSIDDIGGEVLSDDEVAGLENSDREMNRIRERWADERVKIYRRLKVTADEEKQLAHAADEFEGELQIQTELLSPNESTPHSRISDEINRELADAAGRFDRRTAEILGPERFDVLVGERNKFNERLRAEGVEADVGSFW